LTFSEPIEKIPCATIKEFLVVPGIETGAHLRLQGGLRGRMTTETTRAGPAFEGEGQTAPYCLRLFVAGDEINSAAAKAALERVRAEGLEGDCRIEIVDILRDSRLAVEEGILVTPALLITGPGLRRVVLGNLVDAGKVRAALPRGSEKP
jgi:hypothetical protein